jgi:hypothetical protein
LSHKTNRFILRVQQDTLIHYLLDELHLSEADHSDALCPIQREADVSLLGEHTLVRPASTEEVRHLRTSLSNDIQNVHRLVESEVGMMQKSFNLLTVAVNNIIVSAQAQGSMSFANHPKTGSRLILTQKFLVPPT